jgi:hypothetical protein
LRGEKRERIAYGEDMMFDLLDGCTGTDFGGGFGKIVWKEMGEKSWMSVWLLMLEAVEFLRLLMMKMKMRMLWMKLRWYGNLASLYRFYLVDNSAFVERMDV